MPIHCLLVIPVAQESNAFTCELHLATLAFETFLSVSPSMSELVFSTMDSLDAVVQERMVVAKEQQKSKQMTLLSQLVEIDMSQVLQDE